MPEPAPESKLTYFGLLGKRKNLYEGKVILN